VEELMSHHPDAPFSSSLVSRDRHMLASVKALLNPNIPKSLFSSMMLENPQYLSSNQGKKLAVFYQLCQSCLTELEPPTLVGKKGSNCHL
jgi:hypothetical protein